MNAVAKEVSQTPITDALSSSYHADSCAIKLARKLETDLTAARAELARPACTDENGSWHNPDDLAHIAALIAALESVITDCERTMKGCRVGSLVVPRRSVVTAARATLAQVRGAA